MSAAAPSPGPNNILLLVLLGAGVYFVMTRQAQAGGLNTAWLANRNTNVSPSTAQLVGQGAGGLGSLLSGVKGLFSGSNSSGATRMPTAQEIAAGVNNWGAIEQRNLADPLYQSGIKQYNMSDTGDPYASYGDNVAANPSPLVSWDSWASGTGGMGD